MGREQHHQVLDRKLEGVEQYRVWNTHTAGCRISTESSEQGRAAPDPRLGVGG